ncbi:MAG TPA: pilus assembly PilX N-terminal domain-containing protein [Candidatus Acidoferrum sp.]|jgi:Tfp pilus assembly protein PilX
MKKHNNQKGSALIMSLIFLLVLSVVGASLMFLSTSETWSSLNYRMMTQARYGAESGVSTAANFIMNGYTPPSAGGADNLASYDITKSPVQFGGQPVVLSANSAVPSNYPAAGVITAFRNAMTSPGFLTAGNTTVNYNAYATLLSMDSINSFGNLITVQMWQITADGSVNGAKNGLEQVTAIMERQVTPAQTYSAFAVGSGCGVLSFTGSASTNSYDSGALVGGVPVFGNYDGNVGANGNLNESGNVTINGTMSTPRTGVGNCASGGVDAWSSSGKATVTGGLVQLPQAVTFPVPVIPPPGATSVTLNGKAAQTLTPGNYGDISISSNCVLTLTPGIYNINSISETGQGQVVIAPDPITHQYGQVTLNVTGNNQTTPIDLSGGSVDNPSYVAAYMTINYAGTGNIKMTGGSASAAVINAPNASVTLTGNSDFYGSVIGNTITDTGSGTIHYDRSLSKNTFSVSNYMLDSFSWTKY